MPLHILSMHICADVERGAQPLGSRPTGFKANLLGAPQQAESISEIETHICTLCILTSCVEAWSPTAPGGSPWIWVGSSILFSKHLSAIYYVLGSVLGAQL